MLGDSLGILWGLPKDLLGIPQDFARDAIGFLRDSFGLPQDRDSLRVPLAQWVIPCGIVGRCTMKSLANPQGVPNGTPRDLQAIPSTTQETRKESILIL